ncbi:hypothetical protein EWF20_06635 [Sulfolobus sp. S-194]|uniref:hypothetical protein n=1 Tax=Sulfolobus sp. S-194 TaxID=2512240 RepID=UPI001436DE82|nr:hypothetical protein [Sulfolobus sp. S-194]QIW23862.1 hypothetical protein EWF20_06635 [Sulfolobus sp. S-194]
MAKRPLRIIVNQIYSALKEGPLKVSELREKTTAYGCFFDFAISYLLTYGIVKKYVKGNEEYFELTDFGKNLPTDPDRWVSEWINDWWTWIGW